MADLAFGVQPMGVGVYSSNFNNRGGTFLVDGAPYDDEAYAAYVTEQKAAGEEPVDRETYEQDQSSDHYEFLAEALVDIAAELGMSITPQRGAFKRWAMFDRDFLEVASSSAVAIGLRSWENDYVVAVGPEDTISNMLDLDERDLALEHGRQLAALEKEYSSYADDVLSYVRQRMQMKGYEARYKTSGYTTAPYSDPASEAELEALAETIKARESGLVREKHEALAALGSDERVEVLRALLDRDQDKIEVVVFDPEKGGCFKGWSADYVSDRSWGYVSIGMLPPDVLGQMQAVGPDGIVAIPREGAAAEWMKARQARLPNTMVVTAAEYAVATGEDLQLQVDETADGKPIYRVVAEAPQAEAAPSM